MFNSQKMYDRLKTRWDALRYEEMFLPENVGYTERLGFAIAYLELRLKINYINPLLHGLRKENHVA